MTKIDETRKIELIQSLKDFVEENRFSQEEIAKTTGVNVAYINALLNSKTHLNGTLINDKYLGKIAELIGFELGEDVFWKHVNTLQYETIIEELLDAKNRGIDKIIIGESGCGKSYSVDRFYKKNPNNVYRITVSNEHTLRNILLELGDTLQIKHGNADLVGKMNQIGRKLRLYKMSGKKPIIIIDEAENLKMRSLKAIKALYDRLEGYCPIVLIGTPHLLRMMDVLREKDEPGIPQLYRRFKAGIREIKSIDKEMYDPFLALVEDQNVRTLVYNIADNYGEINRYVEPSLRASREMGIPLTEKLFRLLHKI